MRISSLDASACDFGKCPEAGRLMKVRILGAATGPAELERDGPHAIHGCLVPSVTHFRTGLLVCRDGD